ncbi:MAG: biotin transporter BioY [Clostridia bacterium]|nr:biotin transporter BioY [Clostridia bacterium]
MENKSQRSFPTRRVALIAVMAAVICVLSPLAVPLSAGVPLSLATLAVMLAGAVLGPVEGMLATLVFLCLGMVGVPVFSGYQAGIGVLFGKTGGFLLGYLPLALCSGLFLPKKSRNRRLALGLPVLGMLLGTVILYAFGTAWFLILTHASLKLALTACVLPFLPGDALKIFAVCLLAPALRGALDRMERGKATVS